MSYQQIPNLQARALSAAGAWYTGATAVGIVGNWREGHSDLSLTIRFTYTKHASATNGRPKMRVLWTCVDDSALTVEGYDTTEDLAALVATTTLATIDVYDRVRDLRSLIDGNPKTIYLTAQAPRWASHIRVEVAEAGDTANPGTVTVGLVGQV